MAPPINFGARWQNAGLHRRYGVERELWLCPDAPAAFSDAYRGAKSAMIAAGYSWTDRGTAHGVLTPCFWAGSPPIDLCALANETDRAIRAAAEARAERARIGEERHAAETARLAPLAAPIREELAGIVADRPWMLGRHLTPARELLNQADWSIYRIQDAERHVSNARGNAQRAAERIGRAPPRAWFEKAADAGIREAALRACVYLSSLDEDWAAIRNGAGWSQVTTWVGHTLSEKPSLDQGEGGHALALLHGHRKQLPDDLAMVLFGQVFSKKRRPASTDAPSLAL